MESFSHQLTWTKLMQSSLRNKMAKKKEVSESDNKKMLEKINLEYAEGRLSKIEFDMWMAVYRRRATNKVRK